MKISEVYPKNKAADLCLHFKGLAINDTLEIVGVVDVLRYLGSKTPEALKYLYEEQVGPIPDLIILPPSLQTVCVHLL